MKNGGIGMVRIRETDCHHGSLTTVLINQKTKKRGMRYGNN
jgi:hypothetical protein